MRVHQTEGQSERRGSCYEAAKNPIGNVFPIAVHFDEVTNGEVLRDEHLLFEMYTVKGPATQNGLEFKGQQRKLYESMSGGIQVRLIVIPKNIWSSDVDCPVGRKQI